MPQGIAALVVGAFLGAFVVGMIVGSTFLAGCS